MEPGCCGARGGRVSALTATPGGGYTQNRDHRSQRRAPHPIRVVYSGHKDLPALSFPVRGRQLVPILVIVARERFHLVQDLGVAIQRLQIVHNGGLSWLHSRLIQIGDAQVCAAANQ